MVLKDGIKNKAKAIVDENFVIEDVTYVPEISNTKLTFGCTGLRFEATVLYVDMRGSTSILNKHNKSTVAKIHMIYFHAIVKIANSLGGDIRSFNGDSLLVFFQGTSKNSLSNAVKAAMKMRYVITNIVNEYLQKYSTIDFGIGIDDGKILCTKIGVGGENNRDLIWIGNPVNKATVISDKSKSPYYIGISSYVYSNLNDDVKYHTKKTNWGEEKVDIWTKGVFSYNERDEYYYYTSYYWIVE
jgi:class 3 adenylate cyclase